MSINLKSTVDRLKNLEAEKHSLLTEIEELKKIAEAKSNVLANEIASLKEEINSLKILMTQTPTATLFIDESVKQKNLAYVNELAEKAIDESKHLGNQVFEASPFSQNFDYWLISLKKVISDFEADPIIKADEQFINDRSHIFNDIESTLSKIKIEESNAGAVTKALSDNNHLLVETDKEYAEKTKELSVNRDTELQNLNNRIHELENKAQSQEEDNKRRKILKKKTEDKVPQVRQDLKLAEDERKAAQQKFAAEQDRLDVNYEKKKQDIINQTESLRKELEKLETDRSIEARQAACQALANTISTLVQRTTLTA